MVQEILITWTIFRFGTHTLLCATGGIMAAVSQKLVAIDALEFSLGVLSLTLELLTECASQRVALYLPEFRHLDACGIEFQGGTHGGEEFGGGELCRHQDKQGFVLQRVDGIDDIVIAVEVETLCCILREDLLHG